MDLAVGGHHVAVRAERDERVERQVVGGLEHAADHGGAQAARVPGEQVDERAVERLGGGGEVVLGRAEVVHSRLGQDHEVEVVREVGQPRVDEVPVDGGVHGRRELHGGHTHAVQCGRAGLRAR